MATILAMIIAVLLDRGAQHIPGGQVLFRARSFSWLKNYSAKMHGYIANLGLTQSYLVVLGLLLPLCVALLLLKLIFTLLFGSTGSILFCAFALFYFLGNTPNQRHTSEFVVAHESNFAILFWFALLGPVGALIYWFLVLSTQDKQISDETNNDFYLALDWLHAVLAWLPARITGFVYALVGNFTAGFNCWINAMRVPTMQSSDLLNDCGKASVDASIPEDGENLVKRAFIAWVILSILIIWVK